MLKGFKSVLEAHRAAQETFNNAKSQVCRELDLKIAELCKTFFVKNGDNDPDIPYRFGPGDYKIEFVEDFKYAIWVQIHTLRRNSGQYEDLMYYTVFAGMPPVKFEKSSKKLKWLLDFENRLNEALGLKKDRVRVYLAETFFEK